MSEESPEKPISPDEPADPGGSTEASAADTPEKGARAAKGSGDGKTFSQLLAGAMAASQKEVGPGEGSTGGAVVPVPVVPVVAVVPPPGFLIETSGFGVSTV